MPPADATPLSDCITALVASDTPQTRARLRTALFAARFGVIAIGVPPGVSGAYRAGKDEIALGRTQTPDGRSMILACADPDVFRRRYPSQGFNAEMDAVSLFRTALSDDACDGVLVNSAASAHSFPIARSDIEEMLRN